MKAIYKPKEIQVMVEKPNKKADKESMEHVALDAKKTKERNSRKTPLVPPLFVPFVSSTSNSN